MPDIVRKDDPITADIERLTRPVELVRELRSKKLLTAPAGTVKDHDRIVDFAGRVAMRLPQCRIMHVEPGERFAGTEFEVGERDITFLRGPGFGSGRDRGCRRCRSHCGLQRERGEKW